MRTVEMAHGARDTPGCRVFVCWMLVQVAEQTRGWKAPELQRVPERITLSAAADKPVDPDELAGITNWLEVRDNSWDSSPRSTEAPFIPLVPPRPPS